MSCFKVYEKFRKELHHLLAEGDELNEEEKALLDSISQWENPIDVLDLVSDIKVEGNVLFKNNKVEEALERYGFGGVILASFVFNREEDKIAFFNLGNHILLNIAACFNKMKEYEQVGRVCSIVLEFSSSNTKALFRRAMAALELGRGDLAYGDLMLAARLDPSNKEITMKIEKVKPLIQKKSIAEEKSGCDSPIGLGLGLSPVKRKVEKSSNQNQGWDGVCNKNVSMEVSEDKHNHIRDEDVCSQGKSSEDSCIGKIKDEVMEECAIPLTSKNPNLVEPNYRFVNRKRPGSCISISKKDVQLLRTGKSIQFFNSYQGAFITIRAVSKSKDRSTTEERKQEEPCNFDPSPIVAATPHQKRDDNIPNMNAEHLVNPMDPKDGMTTMEIDTNHSIYQQQVFSSCRSRGSPFLSPSPSKHASKAPKVSRTRKKLMNSRIRKKVLCRYQVGSKRKQIIQHEDSFQRPGKKTMFTSCNSNYLFDFVECFNVPREEGTHAHNLTVEARNGRGPQSPLG